MTRHCRPEESPQQRRPILETALVACLLVATSMVAYSADSPPVTAARLKKRALDAIRTGAVKYEPAQNEITNRRMIVTVAAVPDASDSDLQDPLVKVFYDQIELELVRKDLLKRQRSRQIMEPYYAKAEELIGKKLAVAQDTKLTDDARFEQMSKLEEQQQTTLSDGFTAVAKSIGMEGFDYSASGARAGREVKLVASKGATIDFVHQTTAELLHDAGKQDKDFPWTSYQQGETATLSGVYYCRVRLNGKETTVTKRVGEKTEELAFPDPR